MTKTTSIERYNPSFDSVTISTSYTVTKDDKNSFLFTASASNNVVTLPDATTLPNGWTITIQNADASTVGLIVRDGGLNTIYNVGAGGVLLLILNDNGSSDGVWHENVPHDHMVINVAVEGGEFNSVKDMWGRTLPSAARAFLCVQSRSSHLHHLCVLHLACIPSPP